MPGGKIFLVGQPATALIPLQEQPYGQEIILQDLLARYPDLLAGDQMTPDDPRRWLLITREMPVPDTSGGGGRWSLDHLFVDQDGTPTFVECKRSVDTRGRREVVAQMLDYAANGIAYWPIDDIRQRATETALRSGTTLDAEVRRLRGIEDEKGPEAEDTASEIDEFWGTVEKRLRDGNVRLIFVADGIPRELRRLVEFLNEKLEGVEVLAVEVRQFLGHEHQVLVPSLVGMTEAARIKNDGGRGPRGRTNRSEFLSRCSDASRSVFEHILSATTEAGYQIYWGEKGLSLRAVSSSGRAFTFAYCWAPAQYDVYIQDWSDGQEDMQSIRSHLLALNVFSPSGKYTLHATIAEDTSERIRQAHAVVLDIVGRLVAQPPASDQAAEAGPGFN